MGNLIDPKPPQWKRVQPDEGTDRVIELTSRVAQVFADEIDNPVTQLTALKLMQKTLLEFIVTAYDASTAKEALRQADEMLTQYIIMKKE
jgi:hypothetical protein